ncbi:MAG: hypothetical protein QG670_2442 [Thermoproteota archaeon]|nr:hypothetical protein [Thermoproteota archaeon]
MFLIKRSEAITVFHDLVQINNEIAFSQIVEINKLSDTDEFELKIKVVLDVHDVKPINEFLEKRSLKMREKDEFIIISSV